MPPSLTAISGKPALIAVGGATCVGKTELVDSLIRQFPGFFCRPKSFTSRPRRQDEGTEEYSFASHEEVRAMFMSGSLLTLDEAYGNIYGISAQSAAEAIAGGRCPVKEVHPKNHSRLREKVPNLVSVIISGDPHTNQSLDAARLQRLAEDNEFYRRHDPLEHDIVFFPQRGASSDMDARRLAKLIELLLAFDDRYPRPPLIDKTNRTGYDAIAAEFDDDRRVTTANFHKCTAPFFQNMISAFEPGCRCLEVGPGGGWLRKAVSWPAVNYTAVDLASQMRAVSESNSTVTIGSARSLPFASGSFDFVVGSLADPLTFASQSNTASSENMIFRRLSRIWGTPEERTNCQNALEDLPL